MLIEQPFRGIDGDMDIDRGLGLEIVAEHLLDVLDLDTGFEHVRSEGVPKGQWIDRFGQTHRLGMQADHVVESRGAHADMLFGPGGIDGEGVKDRIRRFASEPQTVLAQVLADPVVEEDLPLFTALALEDSQGFLLQIQIAPVQGAQLVVAQAGRPEQGDDRVVAQGKRIFGVEGIKHAKAFSDAQVFFSRRGPADQFRYRCGGIEEDLPVIVEIGIEGAQDAEFHTERGVVHAAGRLPMFDIGQDVRRLRQVHTLPLFLSQKRIPDKADALMQRKSPGGVTAHPLEPIQIFRQYVGLTHVGLLSRSGPDRDGGSSTPGNDAG